MTEPLAAHGRIGRGILVVVIAFVATPVSGQEMIGDFLFVPGTDAMTDSDHTLIATRAQGATTLRTARLVWGCTGSAIYLTVGVDEFIGSDAYTDVQWRFDSDAPSEKHRWEVLNNNTSVYAPDASLVKFTAGARPADQVTVRVTTHDTYTDAVFGLAGLTAALRRLPCSPDIEAMADQLAAVAAHATAVEAAREQAMHPFPDDILYVGNPDNKRFVATDKPCWMLVVSANTAVHFRTIEEARAQGYSPSNGCR